jgi:hypothetical protein
MLYCENNLGQSFLTTGVKSGRGDCQDKPSCSDKKNEGPLPPGYYAINPPGIYDPKAPPRSPGWLWLQGPLGAPNPGNRNGIYFHGWGVSNGCISIYLNSHMDLLRQWATQDGGGDLFVTQ